MAAKKKSHYFIKNDPVTPTTPGQLELTEPQQIKATKKQKVLLVIAIFSGIILISITVVCAYAYWYLSSFAAAANTDIPKLYNAFSVGWTATPFQSKSTNMLILGLDKIPGQKENTLLTDTIIVASLNYSQSKLSMLSIPRDLWIDEFKTKINALYYYGEMSEGTTGKDFAASVISDITGINLDHTVIINLTSLEEIIDSLNGIDIDVPQTFTDEKFPRSDVDVNTAKADDLYETITFEKGINHMSGSTALKYIRSRQSSSSEEGTDIARGKRQQQLVKAILSKIVTKEVLKNPHILGNLYKIARMSMDTSGISDSQIISIAKRIGNTNLALQPIPLTFQTADTPGLLITPPITKHNQWVYEPVDPTWASLKDYLKDQL